MVHRWIHEGTVSEGTLKEEDLIPKFYSALKAISRKLSDKALQEIGDYVLDNLEESPEQRLSQVCDILREALEETAPEGYYFGTLEGDGACFGFWREEAESW